MCIRHAWLLMLMLMLSTCSALTSPDGGARDSVAFVASQTRWLGLNDVTWLFPLESLDAGSPFPAPVEILPFAAFDRLTRALPPVRADLARLQVVALRFDVCDRGLPGPCAEGADGVFRLVLQPVLGEPPRAQDVALHAFFAVPRAEVPQVVDELRALAALQNVSRPTRLQVNRAFADTPSYRQRLGSLVGKYAASARLHRLTLFGQESETSALAWVFRGEERAGAGLVPIDIPGLGASTQEVTLFGGDSYQVLPLADTPAGFARALMETSFRAANVEQQLDSVRSLVAVDNPRLHTSQTVQCVSCHLSTTLAPVRAADAGIDLASLTEHFPLDAFDGTPMGNQATRARTLRALGYFDDTPVVSQRVVNETVNVLDELEQRFPAAAP